MIEIKNVTKKYGDFTAIEDITMTVGDSSIYGLVGYNGAGKTTLLKTCMGMFKADKGEVLVDGQNVYDNGIVRANMVYLADEFYFQQHTTLKTMKDIYKGYYPNFSDKVFENMTEAMGLDVKKNMGSFSKGMARQAQIILSMATRPKYMLLDEVFDGIDPQKRNMCKKLFVEYMAETGCSMIMSSHNLLELADFCDHIALINGKKLAMDVSIDDVSSAYSKYRLIFEHEMAESDFSNIPYKNIAIDGKYVTITCSSDIKPNAFDSLNPVHVDSALLSVEEVFLNEMEDKDYDITKIFSE